MRVLGDCFCCLKAKLRKDKKKRGMDLGGNDDFEQENRTENSMNCSPSLSSAWPFSGAHLANTAMGLVNQGNSSGIEDLILPSYSSASMVDSFGLNFNGGSFDVCTNFNSSNLVGISRDSAASLRRTVDMSWNPPNHMIKGINLSNLIHPSLPQFPADSSFIERAARLSCFNGRNLVESAGHFSIPQTIALCSKSLMIPGNQEHIAINGIRSDTMGQSQKHENSHIGEVSMDVCLEDGTSSRKNEGQNEFHLRSHDEEKKCYDGSENELSGSGQDEPSMVEGRCKESSGDKKRKRSKQSNGLDQGKETARDDNEIQHNNDQNPCSVDEKSIGKHGSQTSKLPKEEYIHVRAKRGQATNSHSLAERVRREKISERMKYLQDLVPGCSKVTGKAVMLDEIINYVQSLQRQVEFLSMKLATVNPRIDFNVDGLAKDILKTRAGRSSSLGYSPDISMAYPPVQLSQQGLLSWGVNVMGGSSEILRRTLSSQLTPLTVGFRELSQLSNLWEEDLQNVSQTSFGTATPSNNRKVDGSLSTGDMKVEL